MMKKYKLWTTNPRCLDVLCCPRPVSYSYAGERLWIKAEGVDDCWKTSTVVEITETKLRNGTIRKEFRTRNSVYAFDEIPENPNSYEIAAKKAVLDFFRGKIRGLS